MNRQWRMVREFHRRFKHLVNETPTALTPAQRRERFWFMHEELQEFLNAEDVVGQADGLVDLLYFCLGTLVNMGVRPETLFAIVHQANMAKLWPDGEPRWREGDGKVLKPAGWVGPEEALRVEIERQAEGCDDLSDTEKALDYYKTGARQNGPLPWPRPCFVPTRIRLIKEIREGKLMALPGDYDCTCNRLGAVSISVEGKMLGVNQYEFEALAWGENAAARGAN